MRRARIATSITRAANRTFFASARTYVTRAAPVWSSSIWSSYSRSALIAGSALALGSAYYTFSNTSLICEGQSVPHTGLPGTRFERTFIAVKPDGVQRGLVGEIIARFERKGYKLVGIKVIRPSKDFAAKHYADLSKKPFFPGLVNFFSSGPVVAMIWEGAGVIKGGRNLVGATNPAESLPGSIRGDLCVEVGRNIVHGSDSAESAQAEIGLWFTTQEVASYDFANTSWIYEKP
eukprot:TRINITY_DN917_c0_g1_i1.p1 TRINITY_DN917_c0_g1~~TRINITY_DN917_c0_g1_i1.p1  ORF type:complete len:234 (-),score=63.78 TRINITY_DN917_c0_g1_i1:48-749(-)